MSLFPLLQITISFLADCASAKIQTFCPINTPFSQWNTVLIFPNLAIIYGQFKPIIVKYLPAGTRVQAGVI